MNVIQMNLMGLVFMAMTSAAVSIFSIAYSLQRIRAALEDLVKEISGRRKEGTFGYQPSRHSYNSTQPPTPPSSGTNASKPRP